MRKNGKDARMVSKMNKKPLNKRNSTKNQRRDKEVVDNTLKEYDSPGNPPALYNAYPQFAVDAGTVTFGMPVGYTFNTEQSNSVTLTNSYDLVSPGIMTLQFHPTIGYSADKNSPINRSALRYYTYLRNAQKASAKYDSQDMMMMFMALDSCYLYHEWMRRLYGVTQLYTPLNKYYPRRLLRAMGCNPDDILSPEGLVQLRAYINQFGISLGSYCAPKDFDITVRHMWMVGGLYLDSDTTRAQTYLFNPMNVWVYDNTVATGSALKYLSIPQTGNTVSNIITIGNTLLNGILGDEDAGMISGDVYNAFGAGYVRQIAETPDSYVVLPAYDRSVLAQIENASFTGGIHADKGVYPSITQDPSVNNGAILFTPKFDFPGGMLYAGQQRLLNIHEDSMNPLEVIESTAFCVISTDTTGTPGTGYTCDCFGSDVMVGWTITNMEDNLTVQPGTNYNTFVLSTSSSAQSIITVQTLLSWLSAFDWHPMIYLFESETSGGVTTYTQSGLIFDQDNLAVLSHNKLKLIHEARMVSLFDIPQMGFTSK